MRKEVMTISIVMTSMTAFGEVLIGPAVTQLFVEAFPSCRTTGGTHRRVGRCNGWTDRQRSRKVLDLS